MNNIDYAPLSRLSVPTPVNRIEYIAAACGGKRVLDLGAMDETSFNLKRGQGTWLHEEIAKRASYVLGIDGSDAVSDIGIRTATNAVIEKGDIYSFEPILSRTGFIPEIIVAGEIIEHLENPVAFLRMLHTVPQLRQTRLILTTPNATAAHNCLIALGRRESTHPDHLCILSFKTLSTLMSRAGFTKWRIIPYHSEFAEMKQRNIGWRRASIKVGESAINLIEKISPLHAFGFIVDAEI